MVKFPNVLVKFMINNLRVQEFFNQNIASPISWLFPFQNKSSDRNYNICSIGLQWLLFPGLMTRKKLAMLSFFK